MAVAVNTTTESFMFFTRCWFGSATARTRCSPAAPSVHSVLARPVASVTDAAVETEPPPSTTSNATDTPSMASPRRSSATTTNGSGRVAPPGADCPDPET